MLNQIVWNRTDYLRKMDLALNNLQKFIFHKNQLPNKHLYQIRFNINFGVYKIV